MDTAEAGRGWIEEKGRLTKGAHIKRSRSIKELIAGFVAIEGEGDKAGEAHLGKHRLDLLNIAYVGLERDAHGTLFARALLDRRAHLEEWRWSVTGVCNGRSCGRLVEHPRTSSAAASLDA